ncbi:C-C motif chemokine 25 [Trichosurus vulpecula]|uniref:C-C motif chemokine 25 n=1 Tax=Trichosurus vulpecula TaxID=9337 RepID=UPI00186B44EA|nr:C-C motif chemokine 25 [Trichosurus vulpecula]
MNLQLLTCLLVALAHAVSSQGTYEDCCLKYTKHRKPALLRHIRHYRIQEVNGSCNLRAVIFEFRRKNNVICGNPDEKWVKDKIRELQSRNYWAYWKLREEIKKDHGGNISNSTRLLAQGVRAHQAHRAGRNQTKVERVSGSMKFAPTQKSSLAP